ncbi:hypothetical protein Tco_0296700 [Tanacetum coccineum]
MLSREIKESVDYINYLAKSGSAQPGVPTIGRGQGKGYMRHRGFKVNVPKNKKDEVPRRSKTITVADNLLENPDQAVHLAKSINLVENKQREKERRSKARHAAIVLDKEVNKEVFSTWMAFGENSRNLGSFGEETDEITDLHQILEEVFLTERGDGVASIKRGRRDLFSDGVWNLETASGSGRLKEDLESST